MRRIASYLTNFWVKKVLFYVFHKLYFQYSTVPQLEIKMLEINNYKVADMDLADFGRKEIELAEKEMPALMALRSKYKTTQPLKNARILGCIHMTIQTAVLMETLVDLGAEVRWSSCNIFSTQDHAAAAMVAADIPTFAWKGETEEEFLWCIEQTILSDGKPWNANMVLDDGGDLTEMLHNKYPEMLKDIHGISEETTTGVHRLIEMMENNELKVPAINVNDSVTKSKNDNKYGCRHSLNDAIKRGTDMLMAGKKALVIGYGDVGKGSAQSLRQEGMIVKVSEIDPICAMQACMDGFEIVSPYKQGNNTGKTDDINKRLLATTDLIVTTTGNYNVCDSAMLKMIKQGSVVCNIGHFDNEIDTQFMRDNWSWDEVKPQVHRINRSADKDDYIVLLSEGRLVNLGNATGHPSRIMDGSFANQVLAQMYLYEKAFAKTGGDIYVKVLPKKLDEEVAADMVAGFGGMLTKLTDEQADYINVPNQGPFKPESYKY
ncbi:MAG: Adenosylhomocysteinase [Catillopecten margaritatus gill symbiont]|uniref:Adenosylhomocysteinase n=1 Tax=Catillopecten margaritatus gill symbiont TaxID=3083288 RepID=A0AAU6PFB9_9GAMM